ncbi:hypothetical protein BSLA_03f0716 [Burkholderia stabilis]|nr:hypothetical protein BSLA_03f0716 [Burkholderia stabilis]
MRRNAPAGNPGAVCDRERTMSNRLICVRYATRGLASIKLP